MSQWLPLNVHAWLAVFSIPGSVVTDREKTQANLSLQVRLIHLSPLRKVKYTTQYNVKNN
jgi:hypothetical protein